MMLYAILVYTTIELKLFRRIKKKRQFSIMANSPR